MSKTSSNSDTSDEGQSWLMANESFLFWAMVVLFLSPIWFSIYLPTQDGPAHLYNSHLLKTFLNDRANDIASGLYEFNISPTPTWFLHIILTGLQYFFSPSITEKIIVTILHLSLPASARFAAGKMDRKMKPLAWCMLPLIYNHLFYYGFYSMCFSVPSFLFTFGVILDYFKTGRIHSLFMTTVGSLLCYGMHIIGLGLLGLAVGILGVGWVIMTWKHNGDTVKSLITRRLILLGVAFLPVLLLMVLFLSEKQLVLKPQLDMSGLLTRSLYLGLSGSLFPIRFTWPAIIFSLGTLFSILLSVLFMGMLRTRHLKMGMPRIMFIIFLFFCFLELFFPQMYLLSPKTGMIGGGYIYHRIALFITPVFMLLLASCSGSIGYFFKKFRIIILFTVLVWGFHVLTFYHFNGYLREYIALGRKIPPNTLFMALHYLPGKRPIVKGPLRKSIFWTTDPLLHASNHIAWETGAVPLENYEPSTGYFPLIYRKDMDPRKFGYHNCSIGNIFTDKSMVYKGLMDHYQTKGFPVEYIMVWRMDNALIPEKLSRVLTNSFSIIATSEHGQIYQTNEKTIRPF